MGTNKENAVTVVAMENLTQTMSPDSAATPSHTGQEVNTSMTPEKPSEDGYNWRKYGQKNVKGNEYIKSYYKCSYPDCYVKKQVERSHDGRITDVTYFGDHKHAKPHSGPKEDVPFLPTVRVQLPDCPPSAVDEDKHSHESNQAQPMDVCKTAIVALPVDKMPISVTPPSQQQGGYIENLVPKKRKKGADGADITLEKPGHESRIVVQTVSEVDNMNDGYRWRKYGQKMVKGSPNPRSYYRCSTAGCPVKKHVERATYDLKVVISTYEGQHDHTVPLVRTIVSQSSTPSGGIESNGAVKPKSDEGDAAQNPPPLCITYPTDRIVDNNDIPENTVKSENEKPNNHNVGRKADNGEDIDALTEKSSRDRVAEDKETPAIVIKSEDEKLASSHDVDHKTIKGDNINLLTDDTSRVKVEKKSDSPDRGNDHEAELFSAEEKDVDSMFANSHSETNSNGLQRTEAKPVN